MRNIINISLPAATAKMVRREVKKGKYASISEFFRSILRDYEEESNLLAELRESQKEIAASKGKTVRSLKDLR